MIRLAVVVVSVLLTTGCTAQGAQCPNELLIEMGLSTPNVYRGSVTICEGHVKNDPEWNPFLPPPLSPEQAVGSTWDKLPLIDKTETRWIVRELVLLRVANGKWIYRVDWSVDEGPTKTISFAVTMSGDVIMPTLTKRPK